MSSDGEDDMDTAHGHRMAFSTDNDFKGGRWVNGEFFYEEKREGKTQSKHEATYGVFDNDSSDSDNGSSGDDDFRGRKKRKQKHSKGSFKKKGVSSKPVLFIAKENDPPRDKDSLSTDENADHEKEDRAAAATEEEEEDVAKDQFQKIINRVKQDSGTAAKSATATATSPSLPATSNTEFREMLEKANIPKPTYKPPPLSAAQTDMQWEKSSKGFGKKYLSKFGFSGRLGAKETGVSGVIEVKVRPNQMGLGFGNFTEQSALESNRKLDAEVRGKDYVPLEKNIAKDKKNKSGKVSHGLVEDRAASKAWKLGGVSLKDAEALQRGSTQQTLQQGKDRGGKEEKERKNKKRRGVSFGGVFGTGTGTDPAATAPKQVILDMRGITPKHITDTATINDASAYPDAAEGGAGGGVRQPKLGQELLYNLNVIVDMDELHLQTSQARLESLQTRLDSLSSDQAALSQQAARDKSQLTALQSIHTILERMDAALSVRPLQINKEDILRAFRKVCVYYPEETKLLGK